MMTWNIEGIKGNIFNLIQLIQIYSPDIILLSEPQIYRCDIDQCLSALRGEFSYYLNSEDSFDEDLPLEKSRASGGTLALWRNELDPFITPFSPPSASILPLIFTPQDSSTSIHINVYLPTQGKEDQFMTELSNLSALIDEIDEQYPNSPLYLRGDFNVSFKNKKRRSMLDFFLSSHSLKEVVIDHTTYHHFTGNGNSDSHLDKLIYRDSNPEDEALITIICKLDCPLVSSSHDILLSSWIATKVDFHPETIVDEAPKMQNTHFKTLWTDEGI